MKKLIVIFFLFAVSISATNLRGFVQKCNSNYGCVPSTFSLIQLYHQNGNRWSQVSSTYTGKDGFYYFYNVKPGNYYIRVNKSTWYKVQVLENKWQDIPKLSYNF